MQHCNALTLNYAKYTMHKIAFNYFTSIQILLLLLLLNFNSDSFYFRLVSEVSVGLLVLQQKRQQHERARCSVGDLSQEYKAFFEFFKEFSKCKNSGFLFRGIGFQVKLKSASFIF
jgi:hypothetical protein